MFHMFVVFNGVITFKLRTKKAEQNVWTQGVNSQRDGENYIMKSFILCLYLHVNTVGMI
jgi:hypothetical protein